MGKMMIPFFLESKKRDMIDCRITAIRDVFQYYGIDIDSDSLFLMLDIMDFQFGEMRLSERVPISLWIAGASTERIENHFMKNLKLDWRRLENEQTSTMEQFEAYLDQFRPIGIVIDSALVTKRHISRMVDGKGVRIAALSFTVVVGYDHEKQLLYLDLKDEESTDLFPVDFAELQKARYGQCFPEKPEGISYLAVITEEYKKWFRLHRFALTLQGILDTCEKMQKGSKELEADSSYYTGFLAMEQMISAILELKASIYGEGVPKEIANRVFLFKLNSVRDALLPGSNTCYRCEFGQGLVTFGKEQQIEEFVEVGQEFMKLGSQWRRIIRYLSTVDNYIEKKAVLLDELVERLQLVYCQEKRLLQKLEVTARHYLNTTITYDI